MNPETTILSLTEANIGKSFEVKTGASVIVTLPCTEDSTGYHWVDDSPVNTSEIPVSTFKLQRQNNRSRTSNEVKEPEASVLFYRQSSIGAGKIKINLVAPSGEVIDSVFFGFMAIN